jgi:hypothetical protein
MDGQLGYILLDRISIDRIVIICFFLIFLLLFGVCAYFIKKNGVIPSRRSKICIATGSFFLHFLMLFAVGRTMEPGGDDLMFGAFVILPQLIVLIVLILGRTRSEVFAFVVFLMSLYLFLFCVFVPVRDTFESSVDGLFYGFHVPFLLIAIGVVARKFEKKLNKKDGVETKDDIETDKIDFVWFSPYSSPMRLMNELAKQNKKKLDKEKKKLDKENDNRPL